MAGDLYRKVAFFALDILNLTEGQELNIDMPADLDQFRRDNSHCTVIGGEGLVQLGHDPTNGRALLH